ncbi:MAG: hypothetical protein C4522_02365 [Desulfobacteraceae bacterium]|nr:MAG: hypothetical protein C4522_02365 [Desulfobacteraceae bacterium]
MSILRKKRRADAEETDLDMVPIMNMFLVLIPFLLMSAGFFQLKAINTSVPVLSENEQSAETEIKKNIKLTVVVEIAAQQIEVTVLSEGLDEEGIKGLEKKIDRSGNDEQAMRTLADCLEKIKAGFPASDTVIIIPEENVVYDTIIQTMDIARYDHENPLFPKVVLSGKVG